MIDIRPDHANCLLERARVAFSPSTDCAKNTLRQIAGRTELRNPKTITLAELRRLPSAAFKCEEEVEYHVLEPLLRLAQVEMQATVQRRYDLPPTTPRGRIRTADYAVLDGENILCLIETELDLMEGSKTKNPSHLAQVRGYTQASRAPAFVLMDRDRLCCYRD